ncbi:unnamed protein product, partial [marine sediment metagenome]
FALLIASFIRSHGYSVMVIDADAQGWDHEYTVAKVLEAQPFLGAIIVQGANPSASSTPKMTAASELLRTLKGKAHIKTILGGIHPSALPERTLREEETDFVCQGEGFYTILELLDRLKEGTPLRGIGGLWYW